MESRYSFDKYWWTINNDGSLSMRIILFVYISLIFSATYTIEYEKSKFWGEAEIIRIENVMFKKTLGNNLIFSNSTSFLGDNIIQVNCTNLISIIDEENKNEYKDCKTFSIEVNNKNTEDDRIQRRGRIGGLFIAAGGGLLYSNLDKEMNDGETYEEFTDRVNGTAKIGYGLIIIGGLLIAVGI